MIELLIGTTNPSKKKYFLDLLEGYPVRILTLSDLGITDEPEEAGHSPMENAAIKARFYSRWAGNVLCMDSGLYFDVLPLSDPRQPGLCIRRPGGTRLDDDQMIEYYAALVRSLGGRAMAYYLDGAAVMRGGQLFGFEMTREEAQARAFYMLDTPCGRRREGWPLDSLSVDLCGRSFLDAENMKKSQQRGGHLERMQAFLANALGIEK